MGSSAEEAGDGAWRWHLPQPEVLASAPLFQPEVLLLSFNSLYLFGHYHNGHFVNTVLVTYIF